MRIKAWIQKTFTPSACYQLFTCCLLRLLSGKLTCHKSNSRVKHAEIYRQTLSLLVIRFALLLLSIVPWLAPARLNCVSTYRSYIFQGLNTSLPFIRLWCRFTFIWTAGSKCNISLKLLYEQITQKYQRNTWNVQHNNRQRRLLRNLTRGLPIYVDAGPNIV